MRSKLYSRPRTRSGFSLLELLIALAIVGILASIAYPSFMGAIRKSRRSDAISALTRLQQAQEQHRSNFSTYAATPDGLPSAGGLGLSTSSPDGHYAIAIASNTAIGYVATATAKSTSPQVDDGTCQVLTISIGQGITNIAGLIARSSTNAGGTVNTSDNNPCWVK
jgi:type IV pilus assembly protein PilE